jgi:hypothetical protein
MDTKDEDMGTVAAAAYLNMPLSTFRYHVEQKHLIPRLWLGRRVFTKAQLDAFQALPRKAGRPRKKRKKPE